MKITQKKLEGKLPSFVNMISQFLDAKKQSGLPLLSGREDHETISIRAGGLSRLYKYFSEGTFGIVGAQTPGCDKIETQQRVAALCIDVKKMGYGWLPIKGYWKSQELKIVYQESSLFIPKIPIEKINELAKKYEQEAYVHGGKRWFGVYNTGNTSKPFADGIEFKVKFDKSQMDAYSEWKGREFALATLAESMNKKKHISGITAYVVTPRQMYNDGFKISRIKIFNTNCLLKTELNQTLKKPYELIGIDGKNSYWGIKKSIINEILKIS